jgi:deoxycytidylate deaminase
MRYLEGKEAKAAAEFCSRAAELAKNSICQKAQHGAVIVKDGIIIGEGWNVPASGKKCDPCRRECIDDDSKVDLCNGVYAQHSAIMNALKAGHELKGSRMYHAKLKGGKIVPGDDPHLTPCSRLIQHVGVSEFVLFNPKGYCLYTSEEYNRLSYEFQIEDE